MAKHVIAPRPRGIRRFLRFSLRSLMLVTLAVAAWLGYEVHQARTVQRQAETIRALGGEMEFEASPWSLLRFIEPQTYGRRIVVVEIPNEKGDDAIAVVECLRHLRELRITYSGVRDVGAAWQRLNAKPGNLRIQPVSLPEDQFDVNKVHDNDYWEQSTSKRRYDRFSEKLEQSARAGHFRRYGLYPPRFFTDDYGVVRLHDGSLAEVLVNRRPSRDVVVLLVNDALVDVMTIPFLSNVSLQDVNGDGQPDLAIEPRPGNPDRARTIRLSSSPRSWLGLYVIEPDGFRSLLDEDLLKE